MLVFHLNNGLLEVYYKKLLVIIEALRKELNAPDIPIIIGGQISLLMPDLKIGQGGLQDIIMRVVMTKNMIFGSIVKPVQLTELVEIRQM